MLQHNGSPRIMCLDGGGVRGLASLDSLFILREVMAVIGKRAAVNKTPHPCEYLDLIGGTSLTKTLNAGTRCLDPDMVWVNLPRFLSRKSDRLD